MLNTDDLSLIRTLVHDALRGTVVSVEVLSGGMTNRNYLVEYHGGAATGEGAVTERVVVQCLMPRRSASHVGIDRANQEEALRAVRGRGFCPEVLYQDRRAIIEEYIDGRLFEAVADRAAASQSVGRLLNEIHGSIRDVDLIPTIADTVVVVDWFLDSMETLPRGSVNLTMFSGIARRVPGLRGRYQRQLAHGDVSPTNLIFRPAAGVCLLDWEYVGAGDPLLDVADFVQKAGLTLQEESEVVRGYFPDGHTSTDLALVRLLRFVSMLREATWAIRAAELEFSDFDHREYAVECRDALVGIIRSEWFNEALEELQGV